MSVQESSWSLEDFEAQIENHGWLNERESRELLRRAGLNSCVDGFVQMSPRLARAYVRLLDAARALDTGLRGVATVITLDRAVADIDFILKGGANMRAAENASTPVGLGMAGERPDADEKVDRLKVEPDGRPGKVAHSDATPDGGEEQPYEEPAWRAGRKLGRSIYYHEQYRGMLESPGLAARVVDLLNQDERRIASASPT